ncbi:sigma-70 family RNA polymerase sigma factor [Paenibacillus larvae]|nr:sigma-70 family RNA polymerase sigma factor [Paenibacillus larvae]
MDLVESSSDDKEKTVADLVEEQIRNDILHQAINQLKPKYRQIIIEFYFQEKPYKEIAQRLGLSQQALAQTLFRARKKLLHYFSKNGEDKPRSMSILRGNLRIPFLLG